MTYPNMSIMPRIGGRAPIAVVGALVIAVTGLSSSARAQSADAGKVYVGGAIFEDIKRFSGDPSTDTLSGQTGGGAISVGTSLTTRWDIELGLEVPALTSNVQPHPVVINKSRTIQLQDRVRNRAVTIPMLMRFHSEARRRVQLEYAAGLSVVRLQRNFDTLSPPDTPAAVIPKAHTTLGYASAPVLEADARVAITSHLDLVPAISASVFDIESQASAVVVRPRVGLRWTF